MESLKSRVFCLNSVDLGNYEPPMSGVAREQSLEYGTIDNSLEFALRSVAAEHSDRPMYFVLPALRIESRAGIDCSSGVSEHSLSDLEPNF